MTEAKQSSVTIHEATIEDKEAVLSINDSLYDGLDYLPYFYETFVKSPYCKCYKAMVQETVVGFIVAAIVDDSKTVVTRAARVSLDYQGQGIRKMLVEQVFRSFKGQVHAMTTGNDNPAINRQSFQCVNKKILYKALLRYRVDLQELSPLPGSPSTSCPAKVNECQLKDFFASELIRNYLFPKDRIIVFWVPFTVMPSNSPILLMHGSISYSDVYLDVDNAPRGLLTVSTTYPCKNPSYVTHIDVFGTDVSRLKGHLQVLLNILQEKYCSSMFFMVYVEPDLDTRKLPEILRDVGINKTCEYTGSALPREVILFERTLQCG